jgi:2OG-Fe(II) oxygenase superfamily
MHSLLSARTWLVRRAPFNFVTATDVFRDDLHAGLEAQVRAVFSRGLSETPVENRFARNMRHSDAYSWNLPASLTGPLSLFLTRGWHDLIAELTGCPSTLDVNVALHYHPPGSADGSVHRDLTVGYFSDQRRGDGVNPMDLNRCAYTTGEIRAAGAQPRRVVRAVTAIYYLGNGPWSPGDGGATGLYERAEQAVQSPSEAVPPRDNSLLVFANDEASYHSFMANRTDRFSVICWLHQSWESALRRHPETDISSWR